MNNITSIMNNNTFQKNLSTMFFKLDGENLTKIIISMIAAGTVCYVCKNNGELEVAHGDTKVIVKGNSLKAA